MYGYFKNLPKLLGYLVEQGADLNAILEGTPALLLAVIFRRLKQAEYLICQGADGNQVSQWCFTNAPSYCFALVSS